MTFLCPFEYYKLCTNNKTKLIKKCTILITVLNQKFGIHVGSFQYTSMHYSAFSEKPFSCHISKWSIFLLIYLHLNIAHFLQTNCLIKCNDNKEMFTILTKILQDDKLFRVLPLKIVHFSLQLYFMSAFFLHFTSSTFMNWALYRCFYVVIFSIKNRCKVNLARSFMDRLWKILSKTFSNIKITNGVAVIARMRKTDIIESVVSKSKWPWIKSTSENDLTSER